MHKPTIGHMFEILTVYHGGTDEVRMPKVDVGRLLLDFGPGFYVTDIYAQAAAWAARMAAERGGTPVVNEYHVRQSDFFAAGKCKVFERYDAEWLDFVASSRLGKAPWAGFDYIEGGVADDRVVNTVRLYMNGYISSDDALNRLKYFKPANQICILNQELLDRYLCFVNTVVISENE